MSGRRLRTGYGVRGQLTACWRGGDRDGYPGWYLRVRWEARDRVDRLRRLAQAERRRIGVKVPLVEWVPEERAWWVDEHVTYLVREVFPEFRRYEQEAEGAGDEDTEETGAG